LFEIYEENIAEGIDFKHCTESEVLCSTGHLLWIPVCADDYLEKQSLYITKNYQNKEKRYFTNICVHDRMFL